jgi:hypothetical protein
MRLQYAQVYILVFWAKLQTFKIKDGKKTRENPATEKIGNENSDDQWPEKESSVELKVGHRKAQDSNSGGPKRHERWQH